MSHMSAVQKLSLLGCTPIKYSSTSEPPRTLGVLYQGKILAIYGGEVCWFSCWLGEDAKYQVVPWAVLLGNTYGMKLVDLMVQKLL